MAMSDVLPWRCRPHVAPRLAFLQPGEPQVRQAKLTRGSKFLPALAGAEWGAQSSRRGGRALRLSLGALVAALSQRALCGDWLVGDSAALVGGVPTWTRSAVALRATAASPLRRQSAPPRAWRPQRPRVCTRATYIGGSFDGGAAATEESKPASEIPLKILSLPERFVGSGYYLLQLMVRKEHALTMLLDTGFTYDAMLLDRAAGRLGLGSQGASGGAASPLREGVGATGTVWMRTVELVGASLLAGPGARPWPLRPLDGVLVEDFPQRKIAEEMGVRLDGMLGQGFLEQMDLELDPEQGTLKAWPPGLLPRVALGWTELPTLNLPGDLHGLLLRLPTAAAGPTTGVVGIVDTGASHTVVNRAAAQVLGLQATLAANAPAGPHKMVRGIGLDGSALAMPLVDAVDARLDGASEVTIVPHRRGSNSVAVPRSWRFGNTVVTPGKGIGPMREVAVAVGDIRFFEEILSQDQDSIGFFRGPAALLGQDLLSQLPLRLSGKTKRLWFKQKPYGPFVGRSKL